ncbi:MAG: hypothetical protein KDK39_12415 [Leptospiraceae bacterium]|nr:hypothetical protein [Leptospiraceae bacterium]
MKILVFGATVLLLGFEIYLEADEFWPPGNAGQGAYFQAQARNWQQLEQGLEYSFQPRQGLLMDDKQKKADK